LKRETEFDRPGNRNFFRKLLPSSIRFKIILPYLVLTLAVAAIGTYVVTNLVASSLDERLTNHLLEAGRVVSDNLAQQEISHFQDARTLANTVRVAESLQAGDTDELLTLAQPSATNMKIECLILVDASGHESLHLLRALDGSLYPVSIGEAISELWIIQSVLDDDSLEEYPHRAIGLHPIDSRYYYFTAVSIGLNDERVGVAVVGTRLETLLVQFKANAMADVIVYLGEGRPSADTLLLSEEGGGDIELPEELAITREQYEQLLISMETTFLENINIRERLYRVARAPLRVSNETLGVFGVVLPQDFITESSITSRNTYAGLFFAATVWVIIIGYLVSRRITTPLARLVSTSRAIADGNLAQRTGIHGTDEIGLLATTFDQMTGRLEARTQELEDLLHIYKEASGRMQAILLSIGDGVILEDLNGNFEPLNPAAEAMLEQMSTGLQHDGVHERITKMLQLLPAHTSGPWLEDPHRFEVGRQVFDIHSAPVRTDDDRHLGKVIVLRDVTVEVEAERLKDAFVTHVSHELRTPLTIIKGYTSMLIRQAMSGVGLQLRSFFDTIDRNTDDLIAMVEELLELSEMEARGRLVVRPQPDTLDPLIDDIATRWQGSMVEKNLNFQVEITPDLPRANVDLRRLRWAVMALMRNAWQYTPEGGAITLRVDAQDQRVRVHVSDTGKGMEPEELKQLFTRFNRFTGEAYDNVRGLGLGLYITRAIVEAHEGDMQVVSEPNVGSTFTISLPALLSDEVLLDIAGVSTHA